MVSFGCFMKLKVILPFWSKKIGLDSILQYPSADLFLSFFQSVLISFIFLFNSCSS